MFKKILFVIFLLLLLLIGWKVFKGRKDEMQNNNSEQTSEEKEKEYLRMFELDKIPEFQNNPDLLKKWSEPNKNWQYGKDSPSLLKKSFTYGEVKNWIDAGLKPDEYEFASWIVMVRAEKFLDLQTKLENREPNWLKDNVDIEELRKEWEKERD